MVSLYKTKRWQNKREKILRSYDYLCQESKQYGYSKQAQTVHHIYPVKEYPELTFVDWNLLPVTNQRHNTFHNRNNDEIIERGLYWQGKREREFEEFYKNSQAPPL